MPPVIAFAAVLVAFARRWQVRCGPLACPESIALVAALSLGGLGLLAALLAVGGIFSAPSFSFTAIALAVLAWPWGQRAPRRRPARSLPRAAGLVALLLAAAALRWPPIPADLGGRDQGTYVLRARHTLRTGRTGHTDPVLARAGAEAELRPGPGDILGLYHADRSPARVGRYEGAYRPGFYLTRRDDGEVVPQFLHLHPSLLALFGLVFGPWSMGLVAPLAGVLSALALWALGERLWPRAGASWLAAGLFALSPIAVWTARTPLTESLTGLLLLAAALAVARGLAPAGEGASRRNPEKAAGSTRGTAARADATAHDAAQAGRPADAYASGSATLAGRDLQADATDSTARSAASASHLADPAHGRELTAALLLGLAGFVRGNLWLSAPALLAVLWLRTEPGLRRMSAPTLLLGLLLASLALHLATGYPYLHDEFKRQLGPVTALSPVSAVVLGLGAIVVYLALDAALDLVRGRVRRLPLVLAGLAGLAALTWWLRWAPGPPWSRLDPALPLLGAPLLLAAGLGLVAFARLRPAATAAHVWLLALATVPVTALALYAQRNLPQVGLYYYGRYLVPELLPAACLLAACALVHVHRFLSERTGLGRHARWVSLGLGLGLLVAQALPYLRTPATRLQEFAGAERLIDDLAAELPERAVVLAGGEGWHHVHVFSQLGGALAFGHGRTVLPYRSREAAYAALHELLIAGPAAGGEAPPVYLLLGESTHPLRLPGAAAPLALVDDLLPPPFVARPVAFAELYLDRLTPVDERIPDRVTRTDLRVGLLEVRVDPARRAAVRSWRIDDGRAEGPGPLTLSSYYLPDGQTCLDTEHPLVLDLPPGDGPGSLVLVAQPGGDTPGWRVVVDGQPVAVDPPGPGPARARDTLGPITFATPPRRVELWGSTRPRDDLACPYGGLAEVRLLGPDRGPDDRTPAWTRTYSPPHDLGHRVTPARFTAGRALTRLRPGLDRAREPRRPLAGGPRRRAADLPHRTCPERHVDDDGRDPARRPPEPGRPRPRAGRRGPAARARPARQPGRRLALAADGRRAAGPCPAAAGGGPRSRAPRRPRLGPRFGAAAHARVTALRHMSFGTSERLAGA
ncbi:ArnT family glycosyltransferase [Nannocystis pusilla]|uniref:ArnT family glycosyltransferase n=1 Tax=Nannocystis pusilla TaxID=889268 RepID=UPI003DA2AB07